MLQPDPQRLPEDVQKDVPHAVETAENAAESEEKVTELRSSEQPQPEEAQHEQDVEKQPRPTTSTADSHSASVDSRDGARLAGSLDSAVEEGEDRRYLPVWKQDGAGSYKVHTIPQKLLESLTTHDIVVVWSQLKYEIGKKIWGEIFLACLFKLYVILLDKSITSCFVQIPKVLTSSTGQLI